MGRRRINIFLWGLVFLLCASLFPQRVRAAESEIVQLDGCLPELTAYVKTEDGKAYDISDLTAQMGESDLALTPKSSEIFSDTGTGIDYRVLLDVSTSLSESQFSAMREAIVALRKALRKQDTLSVITFGREVSVLLKGGESTKKVREKLDGLTREKNTHLYAGINRLSEEVERAQETEDGDADKTASRQVGIILTDWQEVKDAGGETSRQEALVRLQKTGTPLYGFCMKSAKVALQDDMGAFLRETGGTFSLFDEAKPKKVLPKLAKELLAQNSIRLHASSNKTSDAAKVLELAVDGETFKKENVFLNRAKPDDDAPTIESVTQEGKDARTIVVTFSEDVLRADNKNNYTIKRGSKQIYTVSEATYTKDDEHYEAKLVLNDKLVKGKYTVETSNVTDNTNEENLLTDNWSGSLDGEGALKAFYRSLGRFWALFLAAAVLLILLVLYLFIKKRRGILVVQDKMVFGDKATEKKHIKSDQSTTKTVLLSISGIETAERELTVQIQGSLIVGRASICDIYFDDVSMSRQHFALEVEGGRLFVTDLESTGGTKLNGQRILPGADGRSEVTPDATLEAGRVTFRIRW